MSQSTIDDWGNLRQFRDIANKKIEEKRAAGEVGSSLQAELDIKTDGNSYDSLTRFESDLKFTLITSRANVYKEAGVGVTVEVSPSAHQKCDRCWHYRADVGANPAHPSICKRCADTVEGVAGENENRKYA